ncbi:MAG: hypothetical protein ACYDCL_21885 [Myxococcales bacterium]
MPSIAALTLVPLLTLGQAAAPATPAPAGPPAPAVASAPPTALAPAASAIPNEFGLPPGYTFMFAKFKSTLYGFVEADSIYDSTRSFVDLAGMGKINPPGSAGGDDGRMIFGVRNSRLGYNLEAPQFAGIRASGTLEMDFLGNQPGSPPYGSSTPSISEGAYFTNPTFRIRHFVLKLDNDYVTLWFGQTWSLIGWQGDFQPDTVEIQGVPGELYQRTPQIRALHDFHFGKTATLEVALAVLRPPQMDAAIPDFQGGLKLTLDQWTGVQSVGQTRTGIQPAALGLSGAVRTYRLPNGVTPDSLSTATGWAGAADVMIPILPTSRRESCKYKVICGATLVGELVDGTGDADMYTGLNGGMSIGAPAGAAKYTADIDPGLAGWSTVNNTLQTVDWRSFIVSLQIYLPPEGKLWLAGSYSNTLSDNIGEFGSPTSVFYHEVWWDGMLFADVTPSVRLGLEFADYQEAYGSGLLATDLRGQFSAFYIF